MACPASRGKVVFLNPKRLVSYRTDTSDHDLYDEQFNTENLNMCRFMIIFQLRKRLGAALYKS